MFGVFTLAIKFDCLFLAFFQCFYWFVTFNFWQLAPSLNICFKRCFKSLFSQFQRQKTVSKELKTWYFFVLHFGWQANGRAIAPPPPPAPPGYATGYWCKMFVFVLKGVHIEVIFCKGENALGVRITSQKFGFFTYFISVAIQLCLLVTWNTNAWFYSRTLDKNSLLKAFRFIRYNYGADSKNETR